MSNPNSSFMSGTNNERTNAGDSGVTDKMKNLVTPESHAAGMMGMGGMGGPGGAAAASALGSNVPSMPSHSGGMSNMDAPNARAFNRDSSHSGFGGYNPSNDNYGRDTSNSETYGRSDQSVRDKPHYSTSSDRDQIRRNMNQGVSGTGNTFSGMTSSGLGTGTGVAQSADTRHQTVDANSNLRTNTTSTGINPGAGVHAQQFSGHAGGDSRIKTGSGQSDLQHQHHMHGHGGTENLAMGCSKCHPGGHQMHSSSSTTTMSPDLSGQERTFNDSISMGKYETTSTSNTRTRESLDKGGNTFGGDSMGKYQASTTGTGIGERRTHDAELSSGRTSSNRHDVNPQSTQEMKTQQAIGPYGSNVEGGHTQAGQPSMTDKILGGAEKMAGKVTGNPDMTKEGELRTTGNLSGVSKN